jgi:hypothetical protein
MDGGALSGLVNVTEHGAAGDGTTNDTAAIQAVLNAYAGKATVFVPDTGHPYMVTSLSLPTGTDLLIQGHLALKPGTNIGGIGLLDIRNANAIIIRGSGVIDGNNPGASDPSTASAGLSADQVSNLRVSGVTLRNAHFWNVNITRSSNVIVSGVTMIGGHNSNEFANGCDGCWFINCMCDAPSNDLGFGFYGGITNSGMIGNTVRGGATGIFVLSDGGQPALCRDLIIADNICYNNFSSGIDVDSAVGGTHQNVVISNNRVYNNNTGTPGASAELWVGAVTNGLVSGNLVSSPATNTAWGIGIGSGSSQINVVGNHICDIGSSTRPGTGLYVQGATLVQASGNTFRGPAHMTSAIGGTAGVGCAFIDTNGGAPSVTITPTGDTVIAVIGNSQFGIPIGTLVLGAAPVITTLPANAANDAAAASAGVLVGGEYRNGSIKMIRVA